MEKQIENKDALQELFDYYAATMDKDLEFRFKELKDAPFDHTNYKDLFRERDSLESEFSKPTVLYLQSANDKNKKLDNFDDEVKRNIGLHEKMLSDKPYQMYNIAREIVGYYRDSIIPSLYYMLITDDIVNRKLKMIIEKSQVESVKLLQKQAEASLTLQLADKFDSMIEKEAMRNEMMLEHETKRNEENEAKMREFYERMINSQQVQKPKESVVKKSQESVDNEEEGVSVPLSLAEEKKIVGLREALRQPANIPINLDEKKIVEHSVEIASPQPQKRQLNFNQSFKEQGINHVDISGFKYNFPKEVNPLDGEKIRAYFENVFLPNKSPHMRKGISYLSEGFMSVGKCLMDLKGTGVSVMPDVITNFIKALKVYVEENKDAILSCAD